MGGPARTLATTFGCNVEVLDLTDAFIHARTALTARLGLSDKVTFRQGNALNMPYQDGEFDRVWTQHSTMNIADKPLLYREIYRVLRRNGSLAYHEIMAGTGDSLHFPVPWANTPDISPLQTESAVRLILQEQGFQEKWVADTTYHAIA